ncbi:MAG: hypothetical protein WBC31_11935 [Candidatus Phosphoribacter baldrii]
MSALAFVNRQFVHRPPHRSAPTPDVVWLDEVVGAPIERLILVATASPGRRQPRATGPAS